MVECQVGNSRFEKAGGNRSRSPTLSAGHGERFQESRSSSGNGGNQWEFALLIFGQC
jgi:hypothetical protein